MEADRLTIESSTTSNLSKAYRDICTFVLQLNRSLCPRKDATKGTQLFTLSTPRNDPAIVTSLQSLLAKVESIISEAPPDPNNMDTPNELSRDKTNYELLQQMKSYTSPEVKIVHESYEKKMERWKRMGDDEFCYVNGNLVPNYVNEARAGS